MLDFLIEIMDTSHNFGFRRLTWRGLDSIQHGIRFKYLQNLVPLYLKSQKLIPLAGILSPLFEMPNHSSVKKISSHPGQIPAQDLESF